MLGTRVDATSYEQATRRILEWAREGGRYVCAANVHVVMEAHDDPSFQAAVNGASLVTPDGMPLVWALRLLGVPRQARVYGPTLMLRVCAAAAEQGVPVGFYGGRPEHLAPLVDRLGRRFSRLRIAYAEAPPFRPLSPEEDGAASRAISNSGARVLFVGLGCPAQERWMAAHQSLPAVLLGVGAAFDFHSGRLRQAPPLLQRAGLEWAFRLATEPRRLWRRYLFHNPRYLALLARQLASGARSSGGRR